MVVQNLPSERKLPMGKMQKKVKKKTNNSAFSATHTYIKPTLVSFFLLFYFVHLPLTVILSLGPKLAQMAKKTTDEIVLFCVPRAH